MPFFLDEFAAHVKEKQDYLRHKMISGKNNPLFESFQKHFEVLWIPVDPKPLSNSIEREVLAVDSSIYRNLLSIGGIFYIIRSLAVHRKNSWKKLETDVIFTKKGPTHINLFTGRKMELLEFEVAIDALKGGFDGEVILIDGSLYGRAVHLPVEFKVEEEPDLMVHYFQSYIRLLDLCRDKNVLLIGVSKESRTTFFRDYILSLIFEEELEKTDLSSETTKRLKEIFSDVLDDENMAFNKLEELKREIIEVPEIFEIIFKELASSRPDHQLIINLASSTGYTQPLLLGPSARMLRRINQFRSDPKEYVKKYFPNTVREKGEEFINMAVDVFSRIMELPSFISFHILLDPRDSPIRVDIPAWNHRFCDILWPKPAENNEALIKVLEILKKGYGGLACHNLWLRDVDEKVRLRRKIVDEIYFPYLEKTFHVKIIRGRGYRRVKYP